jgi:twinkle protein
MRDQTYYDFVRHDPCEACGSKDNKAVYGDGHSYCFGCKAEEDGEPTKDSEDSEVDEGSVLTEAAFLSTHPKSLGKRRLRLSTSEKYGYGVGDCRGEGVQVAPYYNSKGRLVAQKVRTPGKDFFVIGSMKDAMLFGQQNWSKTTGRMVVITEGELDAMSAAQAQSVDCRWPVVSVPLGSAGAKKAVAAQLDWLSGFERIVLLFDNDEPGQEAALECAEILPPGTACIASMPLKDASDMLQADRGDEIKQAIWGAKPWRPDGVMTAREVIEEMDEEPPVSVPYPYEELQSRTRGQRDAEIIVVCGGTGSGKTTLVHEVASHTMHGGERVAYVGLEEPVARVLTGFASLAANEPLHLREDPVTHDELVEHLGTNIDNLYLYNSKGVVAVAPILSKIRYLVVALGCRTVVLDHITIMMAGSDAGQDERTKLDSLCTKLAQLCRELSFRLIVISHLKRPGQGKGFEEGRRPTLADLRGSSMIEALADVVIGIARDQQAETDEERCAVDIHLLKCRFTGLTGPAGHATYNRKTGRLKEAEAPGSTFQFDESEKGETTEREF